MMTANIFLSVFFLSGALDACPAALFITTPKEMEALSGSCLQIPCIFSTIMNANPPFEATKTTYGIWIKNTVNFRRPGSVIFNKTNNNNPKSDIGNLSEKNCTTFFPNITTDFAAKYYFRIDNLGFMATASCDPIEIKVTDSAPRPRIDISGDGDVNDLKENQSVTITCSAVTPCPHSPPELTWTRQQDPRNIREQNKNGTFTTKIQETITLSDTHDGLNIECTARYPVNEERDVKTAAGEITLSVSYAPKDTSMFVSPSRLVSAGSWVNLTCSSRGNPPISSFTWFKNSKDGAMKVSEGWFYRLNVTDEADYFCEAMNDLGMEKSQVIHLGIEGDSLLVGTVLGVIVVIIVLIGLLVFFWRLKSTQKTQSQTAAEVPASKMEEEEDIHYGEIDFSKRRPEVSSASMQDSGQQQETLYAEVKVPGKANSSAKTAEGQEDLYAQVKRK